MDVMQFVTTDLVIGPLVLPFTLLELGLVFLLPWLLILGSIRLVFVALRRLVQNAPWREEARTSVVRWVRLITRLAATLTTVVLLSRLLGGEISRWAKTIYRILNQPFFVSGTTEVSVITLVLVIPVFYVASWLGRATKNMFETGLVERLNLDPARQFSLLSILRWSVMTISVVIGLSIIGINLSSLAVLFGVLGIGVGFGLQGVVGNMFAGLVIIFARPIKEGDRILVGDIEGTVQTIKFIHTVVNTITNETIIIPNKDLTESNVHNYSYENPSIIVCNPVQVSYSSDLERVERVMLEVAARNPYAVPEGEHFFQVWSFDDSGITVRVCAVIRSATDRIASMAWTNMEIWRAFKENGIEIPFPQVDLHVRSDATRAPGRKPGGESEPGGAGAPPEGDQA